MPATPPDPFPRRPARRPGRPLLLALLWLPLAAAALVEEERFEYEEIEAPNWLLPESLAPGDVMFPVQVPQRPLPTLPQTLRQGLSLPPIHRRHGYHPFAPLRYGPGFDHFDYVNPQAPKGGTLRLYAYGSFDSLNPWVLQGTSLSGSPGVALFGFTEQTDTLLMGQSAHNRVGDEPGATYGLIAHHLTYPESRDWVIFELRPEARFNDGTPIRAEDVLFSVELLREQGHPRYALMLEDVQDVQALDPLRVKFRFGGEQKRHMPPVVGSLPILPRHVWQDRPFTSTLEPPVISGPYRITRVEPGRSLRLERDPQYWGRDLPVNRGRYNFDTVVFEFYRDSQVGFEAFKSGRHDLHLDYVAKNWSMGYDFPALRDGRVVRAEIRHQLARPTQGIFYNTERFPFQDRRVREALNRVFDFEWTNAQIFSGAYARTDSWFPNNPLSRIHQLPEEGELTLLSPWRSQLPQDLFQTGFRHADQRDGTLRQRMQTAQETLREAGFVMRQGRLVHGPSGRPLRFEIINYHSPGLVRAIEPWLRNLRRLGIDARYRTLDLSAWKQRLDRFDYDATVFVLPQRELPGPELRDYVHSEAAHLSGSRNLARIRDPVVDSLLAALVTAERPQDHRDALSALDRVLSWQHYALLHWYSDRHRLAWWDRFGLPQAPSPLALGTETWWLRNP